MVDAVFVCIQIQQINETGQREERVSKRVRWRQTEKESWKAHEERGKEAITFIEQMPNERSAYLICYCVGLVCVGVLTLNADALASKHIKFSYDKFLRLEQASTGYTVWYA